MDARTHKSIVMVAGEASGDLHGAHVIEALKSFNESIRVTGAGGNAMRKAGADLVVDIKALSVMGFTAVLTKAPQILKQLFRLKRLLSRTKPDLLLLIDFPDFNLHLAGYAKKLGIPVLYYVSPTVWAWRSKRIRKIKRRVDHMAVILPFEKEIYDRHHIPATYVGHPLLDDAAQNQDSAPIRPSQSPKAIALLPGSREDEVKRLLPCMLDAAQILQRHDENLRFVISCAHSIDETLIRSIAASHPLAHTNIVHDPVHTIFDHCTLAVVASGTASLEAAIYGIPTVIIYQVSDFSFWLGKKLVRVDHIGLANLIAGRRIFPELIQDEATPENVASTAVNLLTDHDAYDSMIADIADVQRLLGQAGASRRVAGIACRLMEEEGRAF